MNAISGGAEHLDQAEQEFLANLKAREKRAINELYTLYNKHLFYYAVRITKQTEEAQDIVNQCFSDLWKKDTDFSTLKKVRTCLYVYVKNRSYNYLRDIAVRQDKQPEVIRLYDTPEPTILHKIVETEIYEALFDAVQALPEKKQKIITEIFIKGKSAVQVAKEMGLTVSDVRETKRRALNDLRLLNKHFTPSLLPFLLTLTKLHA